MTAPVGHSDAPPQPSPAKSRIAFIDIGRGLGALLVVYSHLHVVWMQLDHGISSPVTDAITAAITSPLHLAGQGLGQLAVPFFFLASGFVVTPIALRQGMARFAVNRFFRVYPLLAVVILLAAGAMLLGLSPINTGGPAGVVTPMTVLTNVTLVNYVVYPQVVLLGVTWTLAVEIICYLLIILLLPMFRRATWAAIALQLLLIEVVMVTFHDFGRSYQAFAFTMSLTTLPIMGQIIWAGHTKRIPRWAAACYLGVAWWMFLWAKEHDVGHIEAGYPTAVALAVLLFLLGLLGEARLREHRTWTVLSERTYSIYLVHGITVFLVLDALYRLVPLWLAVPIALAVTAGTCELTYRLVERPARAWGRSLVRSPRPGRHRASGVRAGRAGFAQPGAPSAIVRLR